MFLLQPVLAGDWTTHSAPIDDPLHDVFFLNDNLGWAYTYGTGTVIHTNDGGAHWKVLYRFPGLEEDYFFERIQFNSGENGWMAGDYGYLFRTSDGGKSWQDVSPSVPGRLLPGGKGDPQGWHVLYYSMYFFPDGSGFVSGSKRKREAGSETLLFDSPDGQSWNRRAKSPSETFLTQTFSGKSGYAGSRKGIWRTVDGAQTWERVFTDSKEVGLGMIRGLFCLDENRVWACSFGGKVLRSVDAGQTWVVVAVTKSRLRSLVFVDALHGFAVGDANKQPGTLFETKDGGKSWERVNESFPDLHRLWLSPSRVWAVGKQGAIVSRSRLEE